MKKIVNKTPHNINICDEEGEIIRVIPPEETIRLKSNTVLVDTIDGIRITKTIYGDPIGLPEEDGNTFYIVSQLVKNAFPQRKDLLVPAETVRNEINNITGCRSLGI